MHPTAYRAARGRSGAVSERTLFLDEHPRGPIAIETDRSYRIVVRTLRLALVDSEGAPLAGEHYRVEADHEVLVRDRLDASGRARVAMPFKADYYVRFPMLSDDSWGVSQTEAGEPGDLDEKPYTVRRAETLQMLLYRERGVLDPHPTASAAVNRLVFNIRSPSLLHAGDRLYLPRAGKRGEKRHRLLGGQDNRFITPGHGRKLRFILAEKGQVLAGVAYTIEVTGLTIEGSTDAQGAVDARIPLDATEAWLIVSGRERRLVLGGLDPLHMVTGIQARLSNLGFHTGAIDGVLGPLTRRAIRKFQASRSLLVDGIAGPKTREALLSAYGE